MQSESQSQSRHMLLILWILGHSVDLTDWLKWSLLTVVYVIEEWAKSQQGWYLISWIIGGSERTSAITNASLACIVITFLLFSVISIRIVQFDFSLMYFKAIQHLFSSFNWVFSEYIVSSSLLSRKICQYFFSFCELSDKMYFKMFFIFLYIVTYDLYYFFPLARLFALLIFLHLTIF